MPTAKAATRSILVKHQDGSQSQIENIPSSAKITLGPVSPGKGDYAHRDMALRIYTTLGNQLAVFRDVVSFRDLSLTVKVQKVKQESLSKSVRGPKGIRQESTFSTDLEWEES